MTHAKPAIIPEYPNPVDAVPMGSECTPPAMHMSPVSRHRRPYAGSGKRDVGARIAGFMPLRESASHHVPRGKKRKSFFWSSRPVRLNP